MTRATAVPVLEVVTASTRPGRAGRAFAEWFCDVARGHGGFAVVDVDLAEVGLPFLDEPHQPKLGRYVHQHTRDWSATVARADAFVFVTPGGRLRVRATRGRRHQHDPPGASEGDERPLRI